ncbi:hypothetical protein FIBSPDRAFT_932467 [Athelia psychrophila]|uniref:Nephrocystin 3-like N-terminal domain-containing protein n=1 Tax=Athelia psychrophila TaxID=1759441 RepID=A0A166IW03_9AGAM|nr:hypothetical protein FIBSPDRAFT_932467 [Fibularhizoctonia sp. CBS 109695]
MLRATGSKHTGASTTTVRSLEMQPPVTSMFSATSLDLRLVDEEQQTGKFANPDHYAVLYIDEKPVPKAGYQVSMTAPRWPSFRFNISSVMKIVVYRKRRLHKDALVAQYKGQGRDFLDRATKYELTDERGLQIGLGLVINIDLISISPAEFIKSVTENASLLQSVGSAETAQALGGLGVQIFQILKQIVPVMDEIADAHPVLKMTWTILSSAYKAVKSQMDQDAAICDLARSLQEILGVATLCPALARIEDISEIRCAALEGSLLIADYVGTTSLAARTAKYQLSDVSDQITQCQQRYEDLGVKFNRRVQLETHAAVKETHTAVQETQAAGKETQATVKETQVTLKETQVTLKATDARVQWIQDVQMEEKIEKWMDAPDTSPNFNAARKKHHPDTGSCFTVVVIDSLYYDLLFAEAMNVQLAAANRLVVTPTFFSMEGAPKLRSWYTRNCWLIDAMVYHLAEMYQKCDKGSRQPPIELLEATLFRIMDSFNDIYIAIDSLDECSERTEVVQWIQSIASKASGKLHMVMSSRPESEIMQGLREPSQLKDISISGHKMESDIRSFLNTRLSQRDAAKWTNTQKDMIKETLTDGADGMFRWVALQADRLIKSASQQDLKKQLKSLPRDLNESYARTLSESPDPGNLKRILQWLAYSRRAMAIEEIAEVAVVDFGDDDSGLPVFADPDHVFSLCYGLVTEVEMNTESNAWDPPILKRCVKLAHFSVKEYLISEHILSGAAADFRTDEQSSHSVIAQTSLAYLLHFDKPDYPSLDTSPLYPLAQYAAEHWVAHFHSAGSD